MNLLQHINEQFPTEESAYDFLENKRWKENRACPHCGAAHTGKRYENLQYHCPKCRKRFSVLTNTGLHNTRLPLQKWFYAFTVVRDTKLTMKNYALQKSLGVRYSTAANMVAVIQSKVSEATDKSCFYDILDAILILLMENQGKLMELPTIKKSPPQPL